MYHTQTNSPSRNQNQQLSSTQVRKPVFRSKQLFKNSQIPTISANHIDTEPRGHQQQQDKHRQRHKWSLDDRVIDRNSVDSQQNQTMTDYGDFKECVRISSAEFFCYLIIEINYMDNKVENRLRQKQRKASLKNSVQNRKEPTEENFITTMTKWADDEGSEKNIPMSKRPAQMVKITRTKTKQNQSQKRYSNSSSISKSGSSSPIVIKSHKLDQSRGDHEAGLFQALDDSKQRSGQRLAEECLINEHSNSESMGASLASANFNILSQSVPPIYTETNQAVAKKSLPKLIKPSQKSINEQLEVQVSDAKVKYRQRKQPNATQKINRSANATPLDDKSLNLEAGEDSGSDVSNKLYKSQIYEPTEESQIVKGSLPSIRNASRTPILQRPAQNFIGVAPSEYKGTKNQGNFHNQPNQAHTHSIPSIIVVESSNTTNNIDKSYNVNIGGQNGLNLLINYQNHNNIIQPATKKQKQKKRSYLAGAQTQSQNKNENAYRSKPGKEAIELAVNSSPIKRIARVAINKTQDQLKEFIERDLSFESVERANENRALDLTQVKSRRYNQLYDCDNYSSENVGKRIDCKVKTKAIKGDKRETWLESQIEAATQSNDVSLQRQTKLQKPIDRVRVVTRFGKQDAQARDPTIENIQTLAKMVQNTQCSFAQVSDPEHSNAGTNESNMSSHKHLPKPSGFQQGPKVDLPKSLATEFMSSYAKHMSVEQYALLKVRDLHYQTKDLQGKLVTAKNEIRALRHSLHTISSPKSQNIEIEGRTADLPFKKELDVRKQIIIQMKNQISELQQELEIQNQIKTQQQEDQKAKLKENQYLSSSIEFQKKKCIIYQHIVRDAYARLGFELPVDTDKRRFINWLEGQSFEETRKDQYTSLERQAAQDLFSNQQAIASDPYLLYEIFKVQKATTRKYQPQPSRFFPNQNQETQNQRKGSWLGTQKLDLIVSKIEGTKDQRQGAQTEMKIKLPRNKNAGIEKFYQEFYSKRFADSLIASDKQAKRVSPKSISILSSKQATPKLSQVSNYAPQNHKMQAAQKKPTNVFQLPN